MRHSDRPEPRVPNRSPEEHDALTDGKPGLALDVHSDAPELTAKGFDNDLVPDLRTTSHELVNETARPRANGSVVVEHGPDVDDLTDGDAIGFFDQLFKSEAPDDRGAGLAAKDKRQGNSENEAR